MAPGAIDQRYLVVLEQAAERLGFDTADPDARQRGVMEGTLKGDQHIALGFRFVAERPIGFAVHVTGRSPHLGPLVLCPASPWPSSSPGRGPRVRSGDLRFDGVLACYGTPVVLHAVLDRETRRLLLELFELHPHESIEIDAERITIRCADLRLDGPGLARLASTAAQLSERCACRDDDPDGRLLTNIVADDAPRLRAICAGQLLERAPPGGALDLESSRAMAACATLLVRLRVDALIRLRRHDPDVVWPVFDEALEATAPEVVENAVRFVGELALADEQPRVVRLAAHEHAGVVGAVAWSLGRLGGPGAEGALLAIAEQGTSVDTRIAALDALATVGGLAALSALRPFQHGLFREASVKRAARRTVERIEARVGPAEAGTLSVVQPAGELSVVDGGGELSLQSDEPSEY